MDVWMVILVHQILFQGMFVVKNLYLRKKTGKAIRGKNREATLSIAFFAVFIATSVVLSARDQGSANLHEGAPLWALGVGIACIGLNLVVSAASLWQMKDSWRVGILEDQKTELVMDGIYKYTRNPYFVSYLLMFAAYAALLQSLILLAMSVVGFLLINRMVMKEERFLSKVHGEAYEEYKRQTPRYIVI